MPPRDTVTARPPSPLRAVAAYLAALAGAAEGRPDADRVLAVAASSAAAAIAADALEAIDRAGAVEHAADVRTAAAQLARVALAMRSTTAKGGADVAA